MNKKSIYFHVVETENELIIDDRLEVNWKEIILFPFPFLLLTFSFKDQWIVVFPLFLLVSISYIIFRLFAWLFYSKIIINKVNRSIVKAHFFMNHKRSYTLLDAVFSVSNIKFIKQERSGEVKFLLQYSNYKNYDLLIVKSIEDKLLLGKVFSEV